MWGTRYVSWGVEVGLLWVLSLYNASVCVCVGYEVHACVLVKSIQQQPPTYTQVDVFDENEGWLLCRRHDTGAMGLVPATYIDILKAGAAANTTTTTTGTTAPLQKHDSTTKGGHRREPTLGGDEEAVEPLVPTGPQEAPVRKGTHRREPTFEFEEGGDDKHVAIAGEGGRAPSFEFGAAGQQGGKRGKVIYGRSLVGE